MSKEPCQLPNESKKVLIKKGPVSIESSLKELENIYSGRPEWKVLEGGGVLGIPVQEYRLTNLPNPDREGNVVFGRKMKSTRKQIDHYTAAETIENLNAVVRRKYEKVKTDLKAKGKSESQAEGAAVAQALKMPEFQAVNMWQDIEAEIKVKVAVERMMKSLSIPALVIRSVDFKAISPLKDLGIAVPDKGGEIDIILAYVSGEHLQIVVFEVKRTDTYPWEEDGSPVPNRQAVNKAENQLSKDLDVLKALLAGIPSDRIEFHTLACYPESSSKQLESIFCSSCLHDSILSQDDIGFLLQLRKKTKIFYEPSRPEQTGINHLLTLSSRLLSHQSLLHTGYRELKDKDKLAREKHRFNRKSVDKKLKRCEFVVASPEQQEVIARFKSEELSEKHLVLEGPAGSGKTLVALEVAKNLIESINEKRKTNAELQDEKETESKTSSDEGIHRDYQVHRSARSMMESSADQDLECGEDVGKESREEVKRDEGITAESTYDDASLNHQKLNEKQDETKRLKDIIESRIVPGLKKERFGFSEHGGQEIRNRTERLRDIIASRIVPGIKRDDSIQRELLQKKESFRKLSCPECEYKCSSQKVLKEHVKVVHPEEEEYSPTGEGPLLIVTTASQDLRTKDPILRYLSENSTKSVEKVCSGWKELCGSLAIRCDSDLPSLLKAISMNWFKREIVMVVDEIIDSNFFGHNLNNFWAPRYIRLILVLNPVSNLALPTNILKVSLTVPYRSTKGITSLTRFMAKKLHVNTTLVGEIGSDVEGELPVFIDATSSGGVQLDQALARCR